MEFSYLKINQVNELFNSLCNELKLDSDEVKINHLNNLTPGDFAAVIRQNRFNPLKNASDFIQRLEEE